MSLAGFGADRKPRVPAVGRQFGLSPKQLVLIWRLPPGTTMSMREIGDRLSCDASFVTGMVDRLEEDGLLERRPDPGDRRVTLIALTDKGAALRVQALEALYEPPPEFAALDDEELEQLSKLLEKTLATTQISTLAPRGEN
jgi:DNA-binding MarR family transcriptional regulator